jgi:predicted dehydrogenase
MRVAIIGLGVMGRNHYRVLNAVPQAELVAVCDPLDRPELIGTRYSDADTMLRREDLDAVIVAVPTSSHVDVASRIMRYRVPLLIEKPIASNVTEARKLIRLAESYKVPAVVGHVERFNPVVRSLVEELSGQEIYSISITRIGPFPPRINDVGVLVDLSVHDIDLVHWLTGNVPLAEARVFKSHKKNGACEDNAVITMRLMNDVVASITTNWLTPFKKRTIEVATDRAFYTADLMAQELTEYSRYTSNDSYLVKKCRVTKGEPLLGELRAFLEFAGSGESDGLATLQDGLRTLETIHRHRASLDEPVNGGGETVPADETHKAIVP